MDNFSDVTWSAKPGMLVVGWLAVQLGAVLTTWLVLSDDLPGAILTAIGSIGVGWLMTPLTALRPRLVANALGLCVRRLGKRHEARWDDVEYRIRTTQRLGRETSTLEFTVNDDVVVLGQLELGDEPEQVISVLRRLQAGQ